MYNKSQIHRGREQNADSQGLEGEENEAVSVQVYKVPVTQDG